MYIVEERIEVEKRTVEAEPVLQPLPTTPWSKHVSSHPRRVLCTLCYSGNRAIWECQMLRLLEDGERRIQEAARKKFK
jgi:hypothetical protein